MTRVFYLVHTPSGRVYTGHGWHRGRLPRYYGKEAWAVSAKNSVAMPHEVPAWSRCDIAVYPPGGAAVVDRPNPPSWSLPAKTTPPLPIHTRAIRAIREWIKYLDA